MPEIQKADPEARRRALRMLTLAALPALGLALTFQAHETRVTEYLTIYLLDAQGSPRHLILPGLLLAAPLVLLSIWLFRSGSQVVRARRFPLPGERVIRDTPVLAGQAAALRGRLLQILALVVCGAALGTPFLLALLLHRVSG